MLWRRWSDVHAWVAVVGGVVCLALAYGAVLHLVELVTGDRTAYRNVPAWLAGYYSSLVVLDPLAAVLLAARTRAGIVLAAVVLVSNALANGYANFLLVPAIGTTVGRAAVIVIAALAVALLVMTPRMWPGDPSIDPHRKRDQHDDAP